MQTVKNVINVAKLLTENTNFGIIKKTYKSMGLIRKYFPQD